MTIEELRRYAVEKGYPKKFLDDLIPRLETEYKDGNIDELTYLQLCAYIDGQVEYWKRFFNLLDETTKKRDKYREERAKKEESKK